MGDFKTIETQEELDALIKDRIERERKTLSEKYSDYEELKKKNTQYEAQVSKLSEEKLTFESKVSDYEKNISELTSKIKSYETDSAKTRIALEKGLPYELIPRINGTSEEEIRQDVEALTKFLGKQNPAPASSTEPADYVKSKDGRESVRELVKQLHANK